MELRVLRYFLAVAREENISKAAESLHLTQPTLSRQLRELEEELEKPLFVRGKRRITLTEEGRIMQKRAEEILSLVHKTEQEITASYEAISGDIYIGAGELSGMRVLASAMRRLHEMAPDVHFHIASYDGSDILDLLDKGVIDFGLVTSSVADDRFDVIDIPQAHRWGVLMRRDDPLANQKEISPQCVRHKPLIISRQLYHPNNTVFSHLGWISDELNVVATYNLLYNASLMVEEGLGYCIGIDGVIETGVNGNLVFLPFAPEILLHNVIIRKKYQVFSKAGNAFLEILEHESAD